MNWPQLANPSKGINSIECSQKDLEALPCQKCMQLNQMKLAIENKIVAMNPNVLKKHVVLHEAMFVLNRNVTLAQQPSQTFSKHNTLVTQS